MTPFIFNPAETTLTDAEKRATTEAVAAESDSMTLATLRRTVRGFTVMRETMQPIRLFQIEVRAAEIARETGADVWEVKQALFERMFPYLNKVLRKVEL